MRNIKFRAWDKGTKKWLLGYEYPNLGGFSLFGECMLMGEWGHVLNNYILNFETHGHSENDLVVMQFTGLHDKNGVEIYEGDIINNGVATWEVVFNRGCFSAKMKGDNRVGDVLHIALRAIIDYKIIGNKFENPELL